MLTTLFQQTWQTKLTAFKVGTFPWEPPPVPQPMANPTVPSNVPRPQQMPSSEPSSSSNPVPSNGPNGVRIKTEPGFGSQGYQNAGMPPYYANPTAQQRAAQNLHQKFGAGASQQISQLQAQAAMGAQQRNPMNIQLPPQMTDQQRQEQAEIKRRQQAQQYRDLQQAQQRSAVNNTQTDGADDWDALVAPRRLDASKYSTQADLTIREQVEQMNRSMEGGGLMMPLSEQPKMNLAKMPKAVAGTSNSHSALAAAQTSDRTFMPRVPQFDGGDDEDENDNTAIKDELFDDDEDEDAINSDLDDPDDNIIEEEQDEGRPNQIMLCTYDKVARVKNKWKCTLKDGVLTTGGKE